MGYKLTFLVADDSKISRKWLIEALPEALRKKAQIIEAQNGQECVELFEKHTPDITFLDVTMPIMSGFEALEKIKAINSNATVIMVTADRQKITKEKLEKSGAKSVINKPIDPKDFRDILLGLISQ